MRRSVARLGHIGRIAPEKQLANIHREAGDVARHHRRGRRSFKRDLHECVLHGHRRDAEHAREDRISRVRVDTWAGCDAEDEKAGERQELHQ